MKNLIRTLFVLFLTTNFTTLESAEKVEYLKADWSFKGLFGKFDRSGSSDALGDR